MTTTVFPVALRDATESDAPYVFATWLKSQRRQGDRAEMRNRVYFENEKRRVGGLLARSVVTMAVNPADATHIYGYLCRSVLSDDLALVHFLFVKPAYRKLGVARILMAHAFPKLGREEIAITTVSPDVVRLKAKWRLVYNPYLLSLLEVRK